MSLAFFEHGAARIHEIVKPGMLCAFDFDGTLAPIVKDPGRACIPAAVSRRLATLAEHARVAIISGRSVEDVGARLDFLPDYIVGNHGIEGVPGWDDRTAEFQQICAEWEQRLALALSDRSLFDSGIRIENKRCSLSVHYRLARNRAEAETRLLQLFSALLPSARVMGGKCVFNLLPHDAPHKGMALAHLCELSGAHGTIYVGDDITDEDVFAMGRKDWLTVRIERSADSAAEFYLHHRLDMVQLLDTLIKQLADDRSLAA
ncbi:MAG TPA: trehalose-phosphatase [Noviherbaspirillum sp.]